MQDWNPPQPTGTTLGAIKNVFELSQEERRQLEASQCADPIGLLRECGKLSAEVEKLKTALTLFETDPHQFSKRPCTTCQTISGLIGYPFGCSKLAKLN